MAVRDHGQEGIKQMYATFDLGEAPPNFDCALDPQDDIEGLLSDNGEATEPTVSPALQANRSQEQQLQKSNHASSVPDRACEDLNQTRKQRALEKSREAQKRFRQRQKVRQNLANRYLGWPQFALHTSLTAGAARCSPSAVGCDHKAAARASRAATATADPECLARENCSAQ